MISDEEYKGALSRKYPYEQWLKNQVIPYFREGSGLD